MTAPVDVRRVLSDLVADMGDTPGTTGHQVALVLDAVVELIEAVDVFRNHYSTEVCAFPDCCLCKRSKAAELRLRAALARVGGA